jgi:hypothetical protein
VGLRLVALIANLSAVGAGSLARFDKLASIHEGKGKTQALARKYEALWLGNREPRGMFFLGTMLASK